MTKKIKPFDFLAAALFAAVIAIPGATSHAQTTAAVTAQPVTLAAPSVADLAAAELAKKVFLQLARGTVDRSLLTPEMSKALSSESIASLAPHLKVFGDPASLTLTEKSKFAGGTNYKFAVKFPEEQHKIEMYLDLGGLVGGYFIRP